MIKEEFLNNNTLVKHYSDNTKMLLKQIETGGIYNIAVDVVPCIYTYEEIKNPEFEKSLEEIVEEQAETIEMLTQSLMEMSELVYQ